MDLNYIKKLVKLVDESGVDEIEIEEEGTKIRIGKHRQNSSAVQPFFPVNIPLAQLLAQPAADQQASSGGAVVQSSPQQAKVEEKKYHQVKSPIVGTFYRAPAPNADPYVQIGSTVQPGMVLCIIEAMKLMNEIECDVSGKVVNVLVENGQPVEYNQPLFEIEPA